MWGRLLQLLILGALVGIGCKSKPTREIRPPDVQFWDLPPMEQKQWSDPPTYPEEKPLPAKPKKDNGIPLPGIRGGGGGGIGGGQ